MQILDNFESSYNKFLDARQSWDSLEALQENTDILMPNGFKAFCKEENKWYQLSTTDETDPSTYNWNESDGISIIELTQAEYDLLVENEEIENDRLYLITDGENYEGGSGGKGFDIVDEMPDTAPEKSIVFYNGTSTVDYAKGSFYQMINGSWTFLGATVKLIEVPFSFSLKSISPISENERSRELIFTSSEEMAITQETFNGVIASGVIQGKIWNDIGGSISQIDETTFRVVLDTDVTDSLGQPAQFVSGSSITIPAFSWIDGITKYTHAAETINISETTVQQKLLFNTTGSFDTNTASTSFTISSAYEIPFVLSYMNIPPVAMMDSNYETEVIQIWTSSIIAANDTTTLVFTPNDSTALHGDNIAITAGRLTATANGVTYTYDFSTNNINLRWGNTSYNLGTFNNFASFTAVPTSANSGSVTCTLSPTGLGDDQFELDIMAANLPTVTIDSVECGTVAWTQGQIVASGASGVTTVGGKTVDITWAGGNYSDTDSYGIARTATFVAKSLSVTCGYITKTIVLSSPAPSVSNNVLTMSFATDVSTSDAITIPSTDYSSSAYGIIQAETTTINSNGSASYSGNTFSINSFAGGVDRLGQRMVFNSTAGSITVGTFDFASGDYEVIHASQTISYQDSSISEQSLDMNGPSVSISWAGDEPTISNVLNLVIDSSLTYVSGGTNWGTYYLDYEDLIFSGDELDYETNQVRTGYVQSGYTITISNLPNAGLYIGNKSATLVLVSGETNATWTKDGITWYIGDQTFSLPGKLTSMISIDFRNATDMTSYYEEYALAKCHINFSSSVPVPRVITQFVFYNYVFKNGRTVVSNSRGTVSWPQRPNSGSYNVLYGSNLIEVNANSSTLESDYENTPWGMDGTVTCTLPEINETVRYSSDTPILQVISEASTTITGAHTFSYYFDDDDCDDD